MNENTENLENLFDDVFSDTPEQEAAETAADAHADDNGQREDEDTGAENTQEKPAQDAETNSRQAEARRRREARERDLGQRAYQAGWNEASSVVAELGGIEMPDGSRITSMDELKAYAADRRKERLAGGQATQSDIEHIVDERLRQAQKPDPAGNPAVQQQLELIRELDPAMTDLGAILQSDIGDSFKQHVQSGDTFVQAYGKAIRERSARTDGARAAEAAKAAGKGHLSSTSTRGEGALSVPPDEMALFRELMPEASDKEIQSFYNADRKRFGG